MGRTLIAAGVVAALAIPAGAVGVDVAAVDPKPGGVYRGKLENQPDPVRIKIRNSGERGLFTLECAFASRERFPMRDDGHFLVKVGDNPVTFKARGRFVSRRRARGEIVAIRRDGATCQKDLYKANLNR
jgi:hypothetical protein